MKTSPLVLDIKLHQCNIFIIHIETVNEIIGLLRELNPGLLAPEARIMPLDQAASGWWQIQKDS